MSGLIKGIGKVFKKIGKFVKKNWKYIAMAVAVYFTAGVALSYFGPTANFAANMWGFGSGGVFTNAATAIGFNGPAVAGAAADMAAVASAGGAAMTSSEALAAFGQAASANGMTTAQLASAHAAGQVSVASSTAGGYTVSVAQPVGTSTVSYGVGGTTSEAMAAKGAEGGASTLAEAGLDMTGKGMSSQVAQQAVGGATQGGLSASEQMLLSSMKTTAKLGFASTALNVASGLATPTEKTPIAFGVNRKGDDKYGWGNVGTGDAFTNMNKRGQPAGSQYAQAQGGSQFLKSPFDAGEEDYNPQQAKEFIAQNA
jgi:hypothetical protein